jgi:hypothetical protein
MTKKTYLLTIEIESQQTSLQLSNGFAALGELPVLSSQSTVPSSLSYISSATFLSSQGFWEMNLTTNGGGAHPVLVGGSDTALMGCAIGPVEPLLFVQPFSATKLGLTTSNVPSSAVTPTYFKVYTDHCTQSVSLSISSLFGDGVFALSQSLFTLDPLTLSFLPSLIGSSRIYGIAPTRNTLAVLSSSGLFFASSTAQFQSVSGLPSTGLDSIRHIDYCDASNSYTSTINTVVVVWDSTKASVIYVSLNGGLTFTTVTVPTTSGTVLDVAVQHTTRSLALLTNTNRIVLYGLSSGVLSQGGSVNTGMTKIVAMPMGEVLVYGTSGVQYR